MCEMLEFELMDEDVICAKVSVNLDTLIVNNEQLSDVPHLTVFGTCPVNVEYLQKFFRRRCFESERPDKEELLKAIGLTEYSPMEIVKVTHGVLTSDNIWIRFKGEDLTFKDVKNL